MTTFKLIFSTFTLTQLFDYSCTSRTENSKSVDNSNSGQTVQKDTSLNGLYTGLEYMGTTTDPAYPGRKFTSYHLGYLKINGDSAFLDQNPIYIYKNDTTFSASDGGFYYYSGIFQKSDTTVLFDLAELFCDYCGVAVKTKPDGTQEVIKRTKQLKGRIIGNSFIIDGYLYERSTRNRDLISEHPEPFLKSQ